MYKRAFVLGCLVFIGGLGTAGAQTFDISSGGIPTIIGGSGASVYGASSVLDDLIVTVDFGEISPTNANGIVKVTIPIAVRSTEPYRVQAVVSGAVGPNAQALQFSDIGFGANNIRPLGSGARVCSKSSHIFYPPFNNDPASNVALNTAGRVVYPSSLNNLLSSATILSGPRLSHNSSPHRQANKGYVFDAILAITPQYYATGSFSATITFSISAGPNVPC